VSSVTGTPRSHHRDPRWWDAAVVTALLLLAVAAAVATVISPLTVAATAAGTVVLALVARRPDLATIAVLVLLYSNAPVVGVNHHGLPFAVSVALPVLLIAPLAYHWLVNREPVRFGNAGPVLVAFGGLHVVSAVVSTDLATSLAATLTFLTNGLALYLLIVNVLRTEHLVRRAAAAMVATGAGLGLVSWTHSLVSAWPETRLFGFSSIVRGDLVEAVDWENYFSVEYPASELRAAGPIGEANFYAFVLVLLLPYAVAFALAPRDRLERLVGVLALPCLLAGVVVTYSRGAAIVVAAVAAALAVFGFIPRRSLIGVGVGGLALLAAVPELGRRLLRLATAPQLWLGGGDDVGDAAVAGRYSEMLSAAHAWADHPLLGLGPGTFPDNYQRYAQQLGFDVHDGPREAHNLYLQFAAELGTFGLLLLLALLAVLLRGLLVRRRSAVTGPDRAFTVAGIAVVGVVVVNGLFLHLAFARYLWVHVALLAAWCAVRPSTADDTEAATDARTGPGAPVGIGGAP
jgi:putative inorganic carbon (hco3(-)) transporter